MVPRTTIVVPCYNEADRLDVPRFAAAVAADPGLDLLFVNDGSTDRTAEALDRARLACPGRAEILDLPANRGKAEAVRLGMLRALAGGAAFAGYWDADLATPLGAVAPFRALLEGRPGLAMVAGARVRLLGRSIHRRGTRHALGRLFATAASLVLRLPVYDTQCGAKLFRATPEAAGLFERPFLSRWVFDVEIIARLVDARRAPGRPAAADAAAAIYEYPLDEWRDVGGSKLRGRDFARAAVDLARIHRAHRAGARPAPHRHRTHAPHAPAPRGRHAGPPATGLTKYE